MHLWVREEVGNDGGVIVFVSASFNSWKETRPYDFACPPELRGGGVLCWWQHTLLVAVVELKR